ncbi:MAG: hypothetical protein J0H15_07305 [Xanthomonadales bacterium]|nr:hypothetical protein [Xanthomonadales bacterium]
MNIGATLVAVARHHAFIMSENVNNLILEMLTGLRNEMRDFRSRFEQDMDDLKGRMSSLETAMITVKRKPAS